MMQMETSCGPRTIVGLILAMTNQLTLHWIPAGTFMSRGTVIRTTLFMTIQPSSTTPTATSCGLRATITVAMTGLGDSQWSRLEMFMSLGKARVHPRTIKFSCRIPCGYAHMTMSPSSMTLTEINYGLRAITVQQTETI